MDVYINRLRNKIDRPFGSSLIKTVRGFGYKLEADGELPSEPEFDVKVNHEKAAQLGFRPGDVQKLVETALWGRVSTYIPRGMRLGWVYDFVTRDHSARILTH